MDFTQKDIDEDGNPLVFTPKFTNKYFLIPSQVNYVAQSFLAPSYNDPNTPSLSLMGEKI